MIQMSWNHITRIFIVIAEVISNEVIHLLMKCSISAV